MRRRSGEIQVFSLSFLDVLSNALGAVLLVLLYTMFQSNSAARTAKSQLAERDGKIAAVVAELDRLARELRSAKAAGEEERKRADAAAKALADLSRILIDLNGPLENVVFVFDVSGSMGTPDFAAHKNFLNLWIEKLPFDRFNVVLFADDVKQWNSGLSGATPGSRKAAAGFVNAAVADGGTNTGLALEAAYKHDTVDTIVLLSDGAPTVGASIADIENAVRQINATRKVVINTVAIGNYFNESYGEFLKNLAIQTGGQFIGR